MAARIVQLTDLHLTARDGDTVWGADVWANLRTALAHVRATYDRVDLLVLTGDLANQRRPVTYARLREALLPWQGRVRVLPGNHDSRRLLRATFGDLLLQDRRTANFVVPLDGWKVIGLDSLRWPFVHGKLGSAQRRWFATELRASTGPVLAFVHHPLVAVGAWWLDKDRLRDRGQLQAIVAGSRLRAFACGHVHQECSGSLGEAAVWTTPATAYQFRPRAVLPSTEATTPAYRVFELDGERIDTRVVRL